MNKLKNLFSPIKINGMELKNRIVMSPMGNHLPDLERTIAYFEARARGGAGMIILPDFGPLPNAAPGTPTPPYWGDDIFHSVSEVTGAIHAHGAKVVPQIGHLGSGFRPITTLSPDDIITRLAAAEQVRGSFMAP